MIDHYHLKKTTPNWDKEMKLTKESIERINAMKPKPKFYVICGDMLDAFPYEGVENQVLRAKQYEDFTKVFQALDPDVKLVCVCGNHDIGDTPTQATLQVYRNQFGSDIFSFFVGGVKFIVLNSQYFEAPGALPKETKRQLDFIEENIADPTAKHIVVFQHIPYFIEDANEKKEYFNLDRKFRIEILDKLRNAGVKYVFCGHYHRNAGGCYKDLELIVTSAVGCPLGKDPSGFRIVNVAEDRITHKYIPFRNSPDVDEI